MCLFVDRNEVKLLRCCCCAAHHNLLAVLFHADFDLTYKVDGVDVGKLEHMRLCERKVSRS